MTSTRRSWFFGIVALIALVLAADWGWATARSGNVQIVASLNPPRVVANGQNKTMLTIRVTEGGHLRAGDLLQIYMAQGGGILRPQWVYTDRQGKARVTYQPNPASPYDVSENTSITIMDTSVGDLIEVDKQRTIHVTLVTQPQS